MREPFYIFGGAAIGLGVGLLLSKRLGWEDAEYIASFFQVSSEYYVREGLPFLNRVFIYKWGGHTPTSPKGNLYAFCSPEPQLEPQVECNVMYYPIPSEWHEYPIWRIQFGKHSWPGITIYESDVPVMTMPGAAYHGNGPQAEVGYWCRQYIVEDGELVIS